MDFLQHRGSEPVDAFLQYREKNASIESVRSPNELPLSSVVDWRFEKDRRQKKKSKVKGVCAFFPTNYIPLQIVQFHSLQRAEPVTHHRYESFGRVVKLDC